MWQVNGITRAFEPVVREIEQIDSLFQSIEWIGFKYPINTLRSNARLCSSNKLSYRFLPRTGGKSFAKKVIQIGLQPYYIFIIIKSILKADVIHSRGPSTPAIWCILFSFFDRKRKYWHKYAGDWSSKKMPLSYRLQKMLLKWSKRTCVTINGSWPQQKKHLLSFENPCLTNEELEAIPAKKVINDKLNVLFVGRLTPEKGFDVFVDSIRMLKNTQYLGEINIVGIGPLEGFGKSSLINWDVRFHGLLDRTSLNKIYERSHLIVLPSQNEGFPKVIAEAAAYGCIPVISNVSSLSQYINKSNGILIESINNITFSENIDRLLVDHSKFDGLSTNIRKLALMFTYEKFRARIQNEILC